MGNRAQTVQAGDAIDQLGCGGTELLGDFCQRLLVVNRQGKEECSQAGIDILFQPDQDQRHAQRMAPDAFAAAQQTIAINLPDKFSSPPDFFSVSRGKADTQRLQGVFMAALRSNGVDNGYHPRIIKGRLCQNGGWAKAIFCRRYNAHHPG